MTLLLYHIPMLEQLFLGIQVPNNQMTVMGSCKNEFIIGIWQIKKWLKKFVKAKKYLSITNSWRMDEVQAQIFHPRGQPD